MSKQSTIRRFLPILTLLGLLSLWVNPSPVRADDDGDISVFGWHGIGFGTMYRSSTSSVNPSSSTAAQFIVVGKRGKNVRLTVTTSSLTNSTHSMRPAVRQSDCTYSLDNGATWNTFSTGTLYQDTAFPWQGTSTTSWILVRVGGSLTSASNQARGTYTGTFTLTTVYR